MRFDDQVIIVAGGGSGIGRAAAMTFAREGAHVVVADLDKDAAEATARLIEGETGRGATVVGCDVTDQTACNAVIEAAVTGHGKLDALVNTVGWTRISRFADEDLSYWRQLVDVNLMSCLFLSQAALRPMAEHGKGAIVLTSSDAGRIGTSGESVYAALKAGVIGFVKSLAREVARDGIRINAVAPGPTDTPLLASQGDDDLIGKIVRSIPLKRLATPQEPADAIVFLASDQASFVTGQTLSVSGGLAMPS